MELFSNKGLSSTLAYMPDRLTEVESWHRHMPFAYWLLSTLNPEVLVELGTHKGDSYCSFCQGVVHLNLATKCYAVDTWKGDSQAGYYGSEILQELRSYHDKRYAEFSSLLQMTFDQALIEFEDGSIDLLHIDGLHTYDAVKHDFMSWKPKLSDRAVVLFHDTSVKEDDFGVWKLWQELLEEYSGFNFEFGYGLGVLQVGSNSDAGVKAFLDFAAKEPELISSYFERLSDSIALRSANHKLKVALDTREKLGQDLQLAREVVAERDSELGQRNEEREVLGKDLTHAREVVAERDALLQKQLLEIEALQEQTNNAIARGQELENQVSSLENKIISLESKLENQKRQVSRVTDQYARQHAQLKMILNSKTWQWRNALVKLLKRPPLALEAGLPEKLVEGETSVNKDRMIDIIIPVYAGLEETKNCIDSVLSSNYRAEAEIIVINDASPEPELVVYLTSIADQVTLLHNERNKGFVATVNRGMNLHSDRDILLLNSDTRVSNDWLDRIKKCAYRHPHTASVTPFSNNATICSYPNFCQDNDLPPGIDEVELDRIFSEVNHGRSVPIPTAVGFCMYIRRDCLQQVGLFDEILFGRGYGEENEFCMRSAESGWQHLLCADTFVYHAGGVSFADTQNEHQQAGSKALTSLYPEYNAQIQSYIQNDKIAPYRFAMDLHLRNRQGKPVVLMINHSRGGGTERHLTELAEQLSDRLTILMLHPFGAEGAAVQLSVFGGGEGNHLIFDPLCDYEQLLELLRLSGLSRVHFHHTLGVHPRFWRIPEDLGIPFDYTIHDYYLACPQITMTDEKGNYCGEPDDEGCNQCLSKRPAPGNGLIKHWREENSQFLYAADCVFVPSQDAERRVQRYFSGVNTRCIPHDQGRIDWPKVSARTLGNDEPLRIVVLGALSQFKGADLLESCALGARKKRFSLEFHLIGYAYRKLTTYPMSNLHVHGEYQESELEQLVENVRPHLVWFPGDCPETYSYTLSSCLAMGLPLVAPKIGAFPERLTSREWTWLMETGLSSEKVNALFEVIRNNFIRAESPEPVLNDSENLLGNYDSDYVAVGLEPAAAIQWSEFNDHVQALSVMHLGVIQSHRGSLRARVFSGLQQMKSRPILAKFLASTPVKWKIKIKLWLMGA